LDNIGNEDINLEELNELLKDVEVIINKYQVA
jgi:hypothetical protein